MITCTVRGWTGCEHQLSFNCCPKCDGEVKLPVIEVLTDEEQAIELLKLIIERLGGKEK